MHEHNQVPTINTITKTTNFSFIDPSTFNNTNKRFYTLPAGLYCWQNNVSNVANLPNANPNTGNSFIVQSSPQHSGLFAYAHNGANKGLYVPAIVLAHEYTWNANPAYMPINPIALLANAAAPTHNLAVASCNMLFEDFYKKYATTTPMSTDDRMYFLLHALQAGGIFYNTDIICFQEWLLNSAFFTKKLAESGFTVAEPTSSRPGSAATCIAYNSHRLQEIPNTRKPFALGNKITIGTTLQVKGQPNVPALRVYSIHLPSESLAQTAAQLNNIKTVLADADYWHTKKSAAVVIAGDFNYNTYGPKNSAPIIHTYRQRTDNEKSYQDLSALFGAATMTNAATPQLVAHPTAFDNGFTKIDYLWYTPKAGTKAVIIDEFMIYPHDLKQLIKHTQPQQHNGNAFGTYFSDHAVIKALLRIQ